MTDEQHPRLLYAAVLLTLAAEVIFFFYFTVTLS
jgi:hypothetical protein